MKNISKNFLLWLIIIFGVFAISQLIATSNEADKYPDADYSTVLDRINEGQVQDVTIEGTELRGFKLRGHFKDGKGFNANAFSGQNLIETLQKNKVHFDYLKEDSTSSNIWLILSNWLPIILLVGVWIYFMRQMQGGKGGSGGGGGPFSFGRSRSKLMSDSQKKITFKDVAGIEEAKEELFEIVDFLKDPGKFQKLGGRIPRGALLVGPPGTGKTLLARAIAGEAGVPFFSISGSDFVEMFVGVGASRVRDMFEQGKRNAPCIIFIDEIDAVGRKRSAGVGGSHEEREQTLNQMLVEMDGFDANEGVIIIAATNRPDVLDPALLRPGRFDRQITVSLPDITGREAILAVHLRNIPTAPDVDTRVIARGTPGFSGAELANIANEAALLAARRNKKLITMRELEEAKDKVMMGVERRSMVMPEEEKRLTAYHEAGHAVVSLHCPASDPIHKATIIPRGRALGMVMRLPENDKLSVTIEKLEADLAVSMGGRVAEELIFGAEKVTSGASSDISMATRMAESMVMRWGMSPKLGPINYASDEEEYYMKDKVSPETKKIIDSEVKRIVTEGHDRARDILTRNRADLETVAKALLEYETLSGDEIKDLLAGKKLAKLTVKEFSTENGAPVKKSALPEAGIRKEIKPKDEDRPNT